MGTKIGNVGFHLGGIFGNLVDLRFADDMLLFASSGPELVQFVFQIYRFVKTFGQAGLH